MSLSQMGEDKQVQVQDVRAGSGVLNSVQLPESLPEVPEEIRLSSPSPVGSLPAKVSAPAPRERRDVQAQPH